MIRSIIRSLLATSSCGLLILGGGEAVAQAERPAIWTGAYVGAHVGYGTAKLDIASGGVSQKMTGILGGGHAGYNWQNGNFIVGAEADISASGVKKSFTDDGASIIIKNSALYSVRGRLGVLISPSAMLYGTAGYGWSNFSFTATDGVDSESGRSVLKGVVLGGGLEYRVMPSISVRGEVLHFAARGSIDGERIKMPETTIRTGIGVHF